MATPAAPSLTLEEFSRLPREGQRHEMSEGVVISMPPPKSLHSLISLAVLKALQAYRQKQNEAEAIPEAGYILSLYPLTIRQPDVSVLSKERIQETPPDSYFEGAPELAVEIVSPSDSAEDLDLKVEQYLRAGGGEVWVLYPKTRTMHVYAAENAVLHESKTLKSSALPGFSVRVADLFVWPFQ